MSDSRQRCGRHNFPYSKENCCVRLMVVSHMIIAKCRDEPFFDAVGDKYKGRGGRVVERRIFRSKGPGFKTTCCRFKTWAISFMPGEVKDPTQG